MGIKQSMTGSPWHTEILKKEEGDPKRHKRRCKYYKTIDGRCGIYGGKCGGSAHCRYYIELDDQEVMSHDAKKPLKKSSKKVGEDDCCYYK